MCTRSWHCWPIHTNPDKIIWSYSKVCVGAGVYGIYISKCGCAYALACMPECVCLCTLHSYACVCTSFSLVCQSVFVYMDVHDYQEIWETQTADRDSVRLAYAGFHRQNLTLYQKKTTAGTVYHEKNPSCSNRRFILTGRRLSAPAFLSAILPRQETASEQARSDHRDKKRWHAYGT